MCEMCEMCSTLVVFVPIHSSVSRPMNRVESVVERMGRVMILLEIFGIIAGISFISSLQSPLKYLFPSTMRIYRISWKSLWRREKDVHGQVIIDLLKLNQILNYIFSNFPQCSSTNANPVNSFSAM